MIVNGVDTDRLRAAAEQIRARSETQVVLRLPARSVAAWLDLTAATADTARLGDLVTGLIIAGDVAQQTLEAL